MKRNTMLAATLLLATAVLTATAQEARAAGEWPNRYRCGAGSFDQRSVTSYPVTDDDSGTIAVSVHGSLRCEVPVDNASFALAFYWVGNAYGRIDRNYGFQAYASKDGPHPFHAVGGITPQGPVTVCVLSDLDLRLACLEVSSSMTGAIGTVSTRVVSPSDRSVDLPIRFSDITTDPGCGSCWSVKP